MWEREECQEAILDTGKMPSKWKLDPTEICAGGVKGLDLIFSLWSISRTLWQIHYSNNFVTGTKLSIANWHLTSSHILTPGYRDTSAAPIDLESLHFTAVTFVQVAPLQARTPARATAEGRWYVRAARAPPTCRRAS